MKLTQDTGSDRYLIGGYDRGELRVNGTVHTRSLLVSPQRIAPDWAPQGFEDLVPEHFDLLLEWAPEVVLIGTGARQRFPDAAIRRLFQARGVGLEVMDTAAACRTYNILVLEDRRVAAALLMIED